MKKLQQNTKETNKNKQKNKKKEKKNKKRETKEKQKERKKERERESISCQVGRACACLAGCLGFDSLPRTKETPFRF